MTDDNRAEMTRRLAMSIADVMTRVGTARLVEATSRRPGFRQPSHDEIRRVGRLIQDGLVRAAGEAAKRERQRLPRSEAELKLTMDRITPDLEVEAGKIADAAIRTIGKVPGLR